LADSKQGSFKTGVSIWEARVLAGLGVVQVGHATPQTSISSVGPIVVIGMATATVYDRTAPPGNAKSWKPGSSF
jgi:hypothetical protein